MIKGRDLKEFGLYWCRRAKGDKWFFVNVLAIEHHGGMADFDFIKIEPPSVDL